ncbi:MAG TPA: YceI family protein [Gemmatimonadales bacterium]
MASSLRWSGALVLLTSLAPMEGGAQAPTRLTIDSKSSLAWWQVSPHLGHLWATTCPEEPTWRPGEGHGVGWILGAGFRSPQQDYHGGGDTTAIPLYPRFIPLPVCAEAVMGEVLAADTVRWRDVRGEVVVKAEGLVMGEARRDAFAREEVMQTRLHPDIRFTIDSLVGVTRQADTVRGTAVGVFHFHGVSTPMQVPVRAWPEAGGLRALGKFRVPAYKLIEEFGLSKFALDLGVKAGVWRDFYMGIDVVLRPDTAGN